MSGGIERLSAALADRYRIERELGQGGMATVYLAEDVKHHRKVAVKVLREDLSVSVGAARFLREIEIVAQLQHPHILPLLDSGEAAGCLYYVMPYVEGQSLRQRLDREHELPVGEAVRILVEMVDALAYAHQHGVVHRDIKPDNVMLSGRHALVADFGIARALSEATGRNTLTSMGVALGTPTYMAPEQAMADPHVDQRADLYSVGVVAYELLTGRPPFAAVTPQQMLAAHVTEKPDPVSRHRTGLAPALDQAIMRCLEKLPADRWQSAGELLAALEPLATPTGGTMPTAARLAAAERPARRALPVVAGAVLLALVALVGMKLLGAPDPGFTLGRSEALTSDPGLDINPVMSPDGKFVAYAAGNSARMRIFVRPVAGGRTIPISDDSLSIESQPRWSRDGSQLLFLTNGGVSVSPAFGGAGSVRPVVQPGGGGGTNVVSADWSPTGQEIAFVRNDSLLIAGLNGSAPRLVAAGSDLNGCSWSPDGRWIACIQGNAVALQPGAAFGNLAPSRVSLVASAGGAWSELTDSRASNQSTVWSPDGKHLLFVSNRDGTRDIYEQGIGAGGKPSGPPRRVTTGLGVQSISLSGDGSRIAYSVYQAKSNIWSLPFPSHPPVTADAAVPVTTGNQLIELATLSRDGRWLVYDSDLKGNSDIYRIPVTGGQPERLTTEPFDEFAADLSPDGHFVAYHAFRTPGMRQVEVKPLDGGPVERVTSDTFQQSNPIWAPDGSALAFFGINNFAFFVSRRTGPGQWSKPKHLGFGGGIQWSPDGRTLVFASGGRLTDGSFGVVLVTMPADSGPIRQVYARGPRDPKPEGQQWSTDGKSIYFKSHDQAGRASIWSVPAAGGEPHLLVHFPDLDRPSFRPMFSTDGKRIYFTIEDRQSDIAVAEVIRK